MNASLLEIIPVMMIGVMVFPLFWGGVVTLISYMSGWQGLAARYAAETDAVQQTRRFRSLAIRNKSLPSNYSGVVTFGVSETSLFISLMILFRMGHKPLEIPFSDLSIKKHAGLFDRQAFVTVDGFPRLTLIVSMKDIEWIEAAYEALS